MGKMRFVIPALLFGLAILVYYPTSVHAQTNYQWSLVGQATPDECFSGNANATGGITGAQIAANNASFNSAYPSGLTVAQIESCIGGSNLPKVNQSYVWGLTEDGTGDIWFGTAANVLCEVADEYFGTIPAPSQTSDYVCDGQQNLEEDFKPARMFMYNPGTNTLTDETLKLAYAASKNPTLANYVSKTIGIRSAGYADGVVFFGGLYNNTSTSPASVDVILYAFNTSTQAFLGYYVFDGTGGKSWLSDIRQWHSINGGLFAGVQAPNLTNADAGELIRWVGTPSAPFTGPSSNAGLPFEDDGNTNAEIVYFTAHTDGHIYATTWGNGSGASGLAAEAGMELYMSPPLNASTGLSATDAGNWQIVWNLNQYEVEPSAQWAGGAIASYGGYLYFGTMQVPGTSLLNFYNYYSLTPASSGPLSEVTVFLNTIRSDTIFRTKGFDSTLDPTPSVQLLYGNPYLEQFNSSTQTWNLVLNGMGQSPLYGLAGFGNVFNNYTWSMAVFNNQLYIGTMDSSYLLNGVSSPLITPAIATALQAVAAPYYGSDLWVFPNANSPAILVNGSGMGNYTSYGIRNMVADSSNLWLGMANPMNLRSTQDNNPGGWKLIKFPAQNGATVFTWYNPVAITYGTPLTATQLDATSTQDGAFTYNPPLGTVLPAGTQTLSVTFVPYGSGNQYGSTVKLVVSPEPLSVTTNNVQMNYGATVPSPLTGTVTGVVNSDGITASFATTATSTSAPGPYPITATLIDPESRLSNYTVTNPGGTLTVVKAGITPSITASPSSVLVDNNVTFTANLGTGTPTGTVTFMDGSTAIGSPVTLVNGIAHLTVSSLALGQHSISFDYSGDANFSPSTSTSTQVTVQDFQFGISAGTITSQTVLPGALATYSFTVSPTYGTTFPTAITISISGLPSGDSYSLGPSSIPAGSGATTVTLRIQTAANYAANDSHSAGLTLAVLFLPFIGLIGFRRRIRGSGLMLLMLLGIVLGLGASACGNQGYFSAQPQTSAIAVTGRSGYLQHSLNLKLTVQ